MLKKLLERFGHVPDVPDMTTELMAAERALVNARIEVHKERLARFAAESESKTLSRLLSEAKREVDCRVLLSNHEADELQRIRLDRMRERSLAVAS